MRISVTGGFGFIGSNLVEKLLLANHELTVIDDLSTGVKSNLKLDNFNFQQISITDVSKLEKALEKSEVIVHLAARGSVPRSLLNPVATHEVNATGTLNILESARKNGAHVIYSSSSSVYGANTALPKNEKMWLGPKTPYAASKLSAEGYAQAYGESFQLPVTILRFFNVYGPKQRPDHQYAAVVPKWIWSGLNDQPINVFGDGTQTRDFTFVDTVVEIIESAINQKTITQGAVNVAYGNNISLLNIIDMLKKYFPNLNVNFQSPRTGDIQASQNDPKLLKSLFPNVSPTDFASGLDQTVSWLKDNGAKFQDLPPILD